MPWQEAISHEKSLGYQEQCPVKRAAYQKALAEVKAQGRKTVYLDETGFTTQTLRLHGYAPRGRKPHLPF